MPKGVEHIRTNSHVAPPGDVKSSLMPKGVEHIGAPAAERAHDSVKSSLMPKGVEHNTTPRTIVDPNESEVISDAERR